MTIPNDIRRRLNIRKGDKIKFNLEGSSIHITVPKLEDNIVERTKGILKGIEPELTPEELEDAFLLGMASKIK